MCEFCSLGPNDHRLGGRDRFDPNFSGFFSAAAIENAVLQSRQQQQSSPGDGRHADDDESDGDDDSDGT